MDRLISLFFEIGTLKRMVRGHQQALFECDLGDSIASHVFLSSIIGLFMAEELGADSGKVAKMCLLHDMEESRTGDRNWIQKRYVEVDESKARGDQIKSHQGLLRLLEEYDKQESVESQITKDADYLAQIVSLKEYAARGNSEAQRWLDSSDTHTPIKLLKTELGKKLAEEILESDPAEWWEQDIQR